MDINALLYATGATGFFTSRAFLPAFATALVMRYGADFPILNQIDLVAQLGAGNSLLTSDMAILILGVLSLLEVAGDKVPEAQELLSMTGNYVKPIMAALTTLGVLGADEAAALQETIIEEASMLNVLPALAAGGLTYFFASTRTSILGFMAQGDESDELGLRKLISWAEDLWAVFGIFVLLIFPVIMVVVIGFTLGVIWLIGWHLRRQEEKQKFNCKECSHEVHGSALICPNCYTKIAEPRQVGFFGQTINKPVVSRREHAFRLLEKRRCNFCATPLTKKRVAQNCDACTNQPFGDPDESNAYLKRVSARLPKVLLLTAGLSLVPVAGLIAGIIYYRSQLVTPFAAYIPPGQSILMRIFLRIFHFLLITIQWVPGLNIIVVPLMALSSYGLYRKHFGKQLKEFHEEMSYARELNKDNPINAKTVTEETKN